MRGDLDALDAHLAEKPWDSEALAVARDAALDIGDDRSAEMHANRLADPMKLADMHDWIVQNTGYDRPHMDDANRHAGDLAERRGSLALAASHRYAADNNLEPLKVSPHDDDSSFMWNRSSHKTVFGGDVLPSDIFEHLPQQHAVWGGPAPDLNTIHFSSARNAWHAYHVAHRRWQESLDNQDEKSLVDLILKEGSDPAVPGRYHSF